MEFALPIRHQVGLLDVVDWKDIRSAVTSDLHAAVGGRPEGPQEIAAPLHPIDEPNTCALAHEPRKVPLSPQGPIKPRRAHFQLVRVRNAIGHIEGSRHVPTHAFTIVEPHLTRRHWPRARDRGGIDEQAHHPSRRFATVVDLDQIEAGVADVGLGEEPQILYFLSHAGLIRRYLFPFCLVSGLCQRAKKKGGHAAHPSLEGGNAKFQGRVL